MKFTTLATSTLLGSITYWSTTTHHTSSSCSHVQAFVFPAVTTGRMQIGLINQRRAQDIVKQSSPQRPSPLKDRFILSVSLTDSDTQSYLNEKDTDDISLMEPGPDGIYHIETAAQHKAFLAANPNNLVICKVFAPWCRACKTVEPKFAAIAKDPKYKGLPIVWASLTVAGNKEYIKEQGILALPTMLYYAGSEGLVENFPCGPSKIPMMRRKLDQFVNDWVDTNTMQLKVMMQPSDIMAMEEDAPCAERSIVNTSSEYTGLSIEGVALSQEALAKFRQIPFFKDFTEEEFVQTIQKAKLRTWEQGSVIMREGKKGRTFYVIESGEVEIFVRTAFEDPMAATSNYLGAMINRFSKGEYFGERALITGEPRAASVRASAKTRCFAFDKDDIPSSSVLSGKGVPTPMRIEQVNDKYGVDVSNIELIEVRKSIEDSKMGSQIRGSVNRPELIRGVDLDEEEEAVDDVVEGPIQPSISTSKDTIINLLQRLRSIKYAARCFNYIIKTRPSWSPGARRRRSMLVDKLTAAQTQEFKELFSIIDASGDNQISLWELKRVMDCVGEETSDAALEKMVATGNSGLDGSQGLTYDDFMGIMAEAEFYQLFTDTFSSLDKHNTGFVNAQDLDRILCGMRDLISDDRKSIIDVEDKEMMIDYEQFSLMLLGSSLRSSGDLMP